MDTLLKDLKYAIRMLWKSPGFTLVAVLTLALGIGANTAMFSVVTAVLLKPLPFAQPERIVDVGQPNGAESYPDFFDFRDQAKSFEAMAAYYSTDSTLTGNGDALHLQATVTSAGMFQALGVRPALGREFRRDEETAGQHVAILSANLWRSRFHGDPAIVGKSFNLNGRPYTVVGVMPAGFQFPISAQGNDLWITIARDNEVDHPGDRATTSFRGAHFLRVVARVKDGVTLAQANAEMSTIAHALATQYPDTNSRHTDVRVRPLLDTLIGETRRSLIILLAAVGCVLLIACANIANLLLARSTARAREMAIRAALGATRTRIVRQLVTESVLLSIAGSALGVVGASWLVTSLVKLYPTNLPRLNSVAVDGQVLLFTLGVAFLSAILFGLAPAIQAATPELEQTLKEGGRSGMGSAGHHRLRAMLVVAETAFGVILLVGAGLLIRSFQRLNHVDPGFNPRNTLALSFDFPSARYDNDAEIRFADQLFDKLRALPGVAAAGGIAPLPMSGNNARITFDIEGQHIAKSNQPVAAVFSATPGAFETMKIPLLRGRVFDERDQRTAPQVVVVSKSFVDKFFPGEDPIGKHIQPGARDTGGPGDPPWREIIGVVGDIRASGLNQKPYPSYYIPYSQLVWGAPTILVRTQGDARAVFPEVHEIVGQMDSEIPLFDVRTMEDYIALSVGREKFQTVLLGLFAGIALLLTAIGLYGVIAYTVVQRTQEIGIRMALGATPGSVLAMLMRFAVVLAGAGIAIGVAGSLLLTRFMSSMLFGVNARDPLTLFAVCAGLTLVALIASYIPAQRATKVDPMVALRNE